MATQEKSFFDRLLDQELADPEFRAGYEEARNEIEAIRRMFADVERHGVFLGLSRQDLAERAQMNPAIVRRVYDSTEHGSLGELIEVIHQLGCEIQILAPQEEPSDPKSGRISLRRTKAA